MEQLYDKANWTAIINFSSDSVENMSRTKCTMYFEPKPQTAVEYITELTQTSDSLVYDETSDNNIRYVGSSPDNYVQFGNYTWRIIGVFNNIDDGSGNKESVIKIVPLYPVQFVNAAWDTDNINDWSTSSLMTELNTNFYNTISSEYQQMIRTSLWNVGGVDDVDTLTPKLAYEQERSNVVYANHKTEWVGNIGIMYISDMTYATNGTGGFDRNQCLNLTLEYWPCVNNNWNYRSETFYWTLDPLRSSESLVLILDGGAMIFMTSPSNFQAAYAQPTLYLKSDVIITEGNGTSMTPYRISL